MSVASSGTDMGRLYREDRDQRMDRQPRSHRSPADLVDELVGRVGRRLVVATPLGIGKPTRVLDELYRRAAEDPSLELTIVTALSLRAPRPKSQLEARLLGPVFERINPGYRPPAYITALDANKLPPNVRVIEFFIQPGQSLQSPRAQQDHVSSNYTHVVRDGLERGVNVIAQLVAVPPSEGEAERTYGREVFSLSSNTDLGLDLLEMAGQDPEGRPQIAIVAELSPTLPFLTGDAIVSATAFDLVLEPPRAPAEPFAMAAEPVQATQHAVALHASSLVCDGGTLQLGIGALSDAVCHALWLRHRHPADYEAITRSLGVKESTERLVQRIGGRTPFRAGLYASTEMLVEGLLHLYDAGILKRRVFGHPTLQHLVDEGCVADPPSAAMLRLLVEKGVVPRVLGADAIGLLQASGIIRRDARFEHGRITLPSASAQAPRRLGVDLGDDAQLEELARHGLGEALRGPVIHAGFFVGSRRFYQRLRGLSDADAERIQMTRIAWTNQLFGSEELKRAQRRHARFINNTMNVTLLGAAASDTLPDGRVVSGVGGQYDFVAMAHALSDARSILLVPSTRIAHGKIHSNIVWSHPQVTIPRHLRDIVVTEYGVADLRGKTDAEVVRALVEVADARFQPQLVQAAWDSGKLDRSYRIPDACRGNSPRRIHDALADHDHLPRYPLGTDLTDTECVLVDALTLLEHRVAQRDFGLNDLLQAGRASRPPPSAIPYLRRLGLDEARGPKQWAVRTSVVYALKRIGAI